MDDSDSTQIILTASNWFYKLVGMKRAIGSFDAKTHLAAYLERVEQGECFVITRRGKPSAELRPIPATGARRSRVLAECSRLRDQIAARGVVIDAAAWVREDRDR